VESPGQAHAAARHVACSSTLSARSIARDSSNGLKEENNMLSWAVTFLIIAIIAALFGLTGIAGTAINIAWILAVIAIILAIVFAVMGRRPPV
jgi:uncharacterized membrane protein YtjA (UPF0391 family)